MDGDGPAIREFLAQRRIALVGASRDAKHFSRAVLRDLVDHGYDVVPVNPAGGEIEGMRAFESVRAVPRGADGAILMTPPPATAAAVRDCVDVGVTRVWFHRGVGQGSVSDEAIRVASDAGLQVIDGECPLMFLADAAWFHRAHRFARRLRGTLPTMDASP